jgi:nickel-dependent lactate racemase
MTERFIYQDNAALSDAVIRENLQAALDERAPLKKVLLIPPDITRLNSYAGPITRMIYEMLPDTQVDILPALGSHMPMEAEEIHDMFGVPIDRFLVHNWRTDVECIGTVPASFIEEISEGRVHNSVPVEVNRLILDPSYDLIISIGQVVPHEVVGMANFNKNIFVGCGGLGMISNSHMIGAIYGMERMMGRDNSPVHKLFDYAEQHFLQNVPLLYVLTVVTNERGYQAVNSLAIGRDRSLFSRSIAISQKNNLNFLDHSMKKIVVYLDPKEFRTTWVGNKSVYRTRMAIADGGELIVLAPGLRRCGEDMENDAIIRKYGYVGRDRVLELYYSDPTLGQAASVAAHLIHGSSDGRFTITYAPGFMTREEIESLNFQYMDYDEALAKYNPDKLKDGLNIIDGEEIYFISNPAVGLWADRERFNSEG